MLENISPDNREILKNRTLEQLKVLHDGYSDEIPEEIVRGDNPENYKYKVRGNWFLSVQNSLVNASDLNLFPEDFHIEWNNFFDKYEANRKGQTDFRTTKEEIDTANNLLLKAQEFITNS